VKSSFDATRDLQQQQQQQQPQQQQQQGRQRRDTILQMESASAEGQHLKMKQTRSLAQSFDDLRPSCC
jgi:hypothetical protein